MSRHTIPWDPKQWLGDDKVLAMEREARSMHFDLLMLSVQQEPAGSIPNDTALLRRWLGSPSDEVWRRVWPQISSAWKLQDGRWFNRGMVKGVEKQIRYLARYENGGKNGAKTAETLIEGLVLPDSVPLENWEGFVQLREKLRKPLTLRGAKLILAKLEEFRKAGDDPGAVLDQSVMRGWQGVFPLEQYRRGEIHIKPAQGLSKPQSDAKTECWGCKNKMISVEVAAQFSGHCCAECRDAYSVRLAAKLAEVTA